MLRSVSSRLGAGSIHLLKNQLQPVGEVVAGCACSLRCLVTSLPQLQQAEPAQQPEQPQKATTKQHLTPYNPDEGPGADSTIVHKHGADLLHDCVHNKGTAFDKPERDRLGLRGLLPPRVMSMEMQVERLKDDYFLGKDWVDLKDPSVTRDHVRKWRILSELKDRNETLFYKLLVDNFCEIAPIVYTPTVGWAAVNYHHVYRRPRGMFFSIKDRTDMAAMVYNWPSEQVDAIVVTDGSRILGLGDLGINGMAIPIGKLDLYVGAAGFHPGRVLPCVIDVGTDNAQLQNNELYLGLHQGRIKDQQLYFDVLDEFVRAVMGRWPKAVLQFEDFNMSHAQPLLDRYRYHHSTFNDDIQGTAATALAGLYGAMKVRGLPISALRKQRIVVVGAGSAGMGVVRMIAQGMQRQGLTADEACKNFWIADYNGLITVEREDLSDAVAPFARLPDAGDSEGEALADIVRRVKPTAIIGLSGAGRLFTPEILTEMGKNNERPIIFPMSNPTSRMECTAEDAQKYTEGRAIFASGSPQENVQYDGRTIASSQANNMYIFPGLAFGAHLAETGAVSDGMIMAAAAALPNMIPEDNLQKGFVYPPLDTIRDISARVTFEVMYQAMEEGLVKNPRAIAEFEAALLPAHLPRAWQKQMSCSCHERPQLQMALNPHCVNAWTDCRKQEGQQKCAPWHAIIASPLTLRSAAHVYASI